MAAGSWTAATAAASAGILADFDPTMQPTRVSFWPFLFVAVALVLLMLSMVRHLRRARENLGSERAPRPGRTGRRRHLGAGRRALGARPAAMTGARLRPDRLGFHLLTLVALLLCVVAARWQWERAYRTVDDAVPDTAVVALSDLDPRTAYSGMRVSVTGRFDPDHQILVEPRQREGVTGAWVLTPLVPGPATATDSAQGRAPWRSSAGGSRRAMRPAPHRWIR